MKSKRDDAPTRTVTRDAELFKDVASWIEEERSVCHVVVGSVVQDGRTYRNTACGRTETTGRVLSAPGRICNKCRTTLVVKGSQTRLNKLFLVMSAQGRSTG